MAGGSLFLALPQSDLGKVTSPLCASVSPICKMGGGREGGSQWDLPLYSAGSFLDAILSPAPCTGVGQDPP